MSRSASSIDNNEYVLTLKAEDIEFEATGNASGLSRAFSESSEIPFMNDEPAPVASDEAAPFFPSDQDQREDISVDDDHAINNDGGDNDIDQVSDEENDDLDHQELVFLPNVDDEDDEKENDDKSDGSLEENFELIDDEMAQQQDQVQQNTSLEDILSNEDLEKKNSNNQEDLTDMLYEEVIDEDGENRENLDHDEINSQTAIEEAFKILHRDDSAEEDNESNKCMKQVSAGKEADGNNGQRQNFVITCVNDKVAEANRVYKSELARVQRKIKELGDANGKNDAIDEGKTTEHTEQSVANNGVDENQEAVIEVEDEIKNDKSSSRDSSPSSPESSIEEGEEKPTPKEETKRTSSPAVRSKMKRPRSNSAEKSSHKTKLTKKKSSTDKKQKDISPFQAFFEDTRYFLIKSANPENVILSKVKGVWSTTPRNEHLLNRAFKRHHNVILIFSVEKSQAYQGFCRMCSESSHNGSPINWVLPPGMNSRVLGGSFKVNWLNRNELPFAKVQHLYNPWNDNKPIKIARDGTEFEPNIGKQLCCSFPGDPATDVGALIKECKIPTLSPKHRVHRPLTPPRGILPAAAMERAKRDRIGGVVNSATTTSSRYGYQQTSQPRARGAPYRPPPPPPPTTTFAHSSRSVVTSRKYVLDKSSAARTATFGERSRKRTALSSSRSGYDDLLINGSYSDYIRHYSSSYGQGGSGASNAQFSSSTVSASYGAYPTSTVVPYGNPYYTGYYGAGAQHHVPSSTVQYSSLRKEPTTYRRKASPSHRGTSSSAAVFSKDRHYRKSPSPVHHLHRNSGAVGYVPSSRRRSPAVYANKYPGRR